MQIVQGSGQIFHRITEQADLIDLNLAVILSIYQSLANASIPDLMSANVEGIDSLTGIELQTCNKYYGGTGYGVNGKSFLDNR